MTGQEIIRLINRYIGVNVGDLQDFSFRTLQEFFPEHCDLDIDTRQYTGTKRERFEAILRASPPDTQARIIRGVLQKCPPVEGHALRTRAAHDEFLRVAERLEAQAGVEGHNPSITSAVVERAIADVQCLIETTGATSGVDRVHTMLHGYMRAVCNSMSIQFTKEATIGELFNLIREQHAAFARTVPRASDVANICRGMGRVMNALNPVRNEGSMAHPTEELLEEAEAILVINMARTMLRYIDMKLSEADPGVAPDPAGM